MSEINNVNSNSVKIIQDTPVSKTETDDSPQPVSRKEVKNLDLTQAAVAGRSMVQPMKKVDLPKVDAQTVENIKSDLKILNDNEKAVTLGVKIADLALAKGATMEEAAKIQKAFADDFMKA